MRFEPRLHRLENSPHTVAFNKLFRESSEVYKEWLVKYRELHYYASNLENMIIGLQEQNKRLTHENEFMIRMLKENNHNAN